MKKTTRLIGTFCFVLLVVGCATAPINVISIPRQEMSVREGVNKNELAALIKSNLQHRGRVQVVLVEFTNGGNKIAQSYNAGNSAKNSLKRTITESGAELVDRGLVKKLKDEILLIEISGESKFRETVLASIAIKGAITTANYSKRFSAAESWTDKKGKVYRTSARCTHIVKVKAILSFYDMNPLSLKQNIHIAGRESIRSETNNANCPLSKNELASLFSEATQEAIRKRAGVIKNHFSPSGFIVEYRQSSDGSINIFRTTMSPQVGATPGNQIKVWKDVSYTDQLDRKMHERAIVAEGEVIEAAGGSTDAWIKIHSVDEADLVKLGDKVEVDFKDEYSILDDWADDFYDLVDDL